MIKTLNVSVSDSENADHLTISGTLNPQEFNETIVLSLGSSKIALSSRELAEALACVVEFQRVIEPNK